MDDERYGIGERVPWGNFPEVVHNRYEGRLKDEPGYLAAKGGDTGAAFDLVKSVLLQDTVDRVLDNFGASGPRLLPVLAEEATGRNKLPAALAQILASRAGLEVETGIIATDVVQRTGQGADHRLAFSPRFDGVVVVGQEYLILDDALTMGGTVASLRGYVENRGGRVVGAAVLSARRNALDLKPSDKQLDHVGRRFGQGLDAFWREVFGYGIECATRAEVGHVRRAQDLESIRERITQARDVGLRRLHARALGVGGAGSTDLDEGSGAEDGSGQVHGRTRAVGPTWASAEQLSAEQRASAETAASIEQAHAHALAERVLAKRAQLDRVERRFGDEVARQQLALRRTVRSASRLIALPSTRRRQRAIESSQRERLQVLVARLDRVRAIRSRRGGVTPGVEQLAQRKLQFEKPELVSAWERVQREARRGPALGPTDRPLDRSKQLLSREYDGGRGRSR